MNLIDNATIYDVVNRTLMKPISDREKAQQILQLMREFALTPERMEVALGLPVDQINAFLALADEPQAQALVPGATVPADASSQVYFPTTVSLTTPPPRPFYLANMASWQRSADAYEYKNRGTPLVYNVTFVDRILSWFDNDYQMMVAQRVLDIINRAAADHSNPGPALEAINSQYGNFASQFTDAIGLGQQLRQVTGSANFGQGGADLSDPYLLQTIQKRGSL